MNFDLILGYHSIYHALNNSKRNQIELFATQEGFQKFQSKYQKRIDFISLKKDELIKKFIGFSNEKGLKNSKLQGEIFLKTNSIEEYGNGYLYKLLEKEKSFKFLALDRVTDIHNAAAILRTSAFYNLDGLIIGQKASFNYTPSFFKISSGAFEYIPIIRTPNLAKTLKTISSKGVVTIGLSEEVENKEIEIKNSWCVVMGSEELGLSHAVERSLDQHIALKSYGEIKSLNVSTAAAIALEKFTYSESN